MGELFSLAAVKLGFWSLHALRVMKDTVKSILKDCLLAHFESYANANVELAEVCFSEKYTSR